MKKIESLVKAIFALCFLCSPVLLMIIGIWMIYNVGLLTGLVISYIGCAGAGFECGLILEEIENRKITK